MGLPSEVSNSREVLKLFASSADYESQRAILRQAVQDCLEGLRKNGSWQRDLSEAQADFQTSTVPREGSSLTDYFRRLTQTIVPTSIKISSPRYIGHMTSIVPDFACILAELLATLNQNLVKKEASPVLTLLERQVVAMMHRLIYQFPDEFYDWHIQKPESTLGLITQGGTLSNLTALWMARNAAFPKCDDFPGVESAGLKAALTRYGFENAVILGSKLMHYSIPKAAGILGLGGQNLIRLPVDADNRLKIDALIDAVEQCSRRRQKILAIVGVAGATDCGSIDPLNEIAAVARDSNIFFHVDAAWCGAMLFSARHASALAGIAEADSVVIDGHKQMYVPVGSSILLFRNHYAAKVIQKSASYILQNGSGDLGQRSIEGSRAGSVIFLHAALQLIGSEGYGFLIDENLRKAKMFAQMIRTCSQFELLLEPMTNIVLYRYIPERLRFFGKRRLDANENLEVNAFNEVLQKRESEAGRTMVSRTIFENTSYGEGVPVVALRAVILNPLIEAADLRSVLDDQLEIAAELEAFETSSAPVLTLSRTA